MPFNQGRKERMMFDGLFGGQPEPIEEGPVTIEFERSKGKQKVTFVVDFGETDLSPHKAATVFKEIVGILRSGLDVSLSKCK